MRATFVSNSWVERLAIILIKISSGHDSRDFFVGSNSLLIEVSPCNCGSEKKLFTSKYCWNFSWFD